MNQSTVWKTSSQPVSFVSHEVESSRLFFLDPIEDEDFAVVFGGFERCSADYRIDRRDFPWYLLEFVSHGSGKLRLGDVEAELVPGSFFVYGPSVPHTIETSPHNPLGKYFVGFTGSGGRVVSGAIRHAARHHLALRQGRADPAGLRHVDRPGRAQVEARASAVCDDHAAAVADVPR